MGIRETRKSAHANASSTKARFAAAATAVHVPLLLAQHRKLSNQLARALGVAGGSGMGAAALLLPAAPHTVLLGWGRL